MKLTMRLYQNEDDYWRIRAFLREVFQLNGRRELSWHVARLDYWRWHGILNLGDGQLERDVFLWETEEGKIASVLNREEAGSAYLQVHPGFRTPELEQEMLALAEERLSIQRDEQQVLAVWTDAQDSQRLDILKRRGYTKGKWAERQWRRDLDESIPGVPIPPGYTVRALGDVDELPARSWASWRAFHPNEPDEDYKGWTWYLNIQRCPLYRRDLDIVAVAPSGESHRHSPGIVAFTTVWYDDVTRSAYFEPVGTMPEYQRRGLARAVITEGLHRLQGLGATRAFVGGYEPGPNALYASTLSAEHDLSEQWVKKW
jgi:ribosomal protein S18 acetylase RimI-like enzyme